MRGECCVLYEDDRMPGELGEVSGNLHRGQRTRRGRIRRVDTPDQRQARAREMQDGACLLCSEERPHQCHRRLVAEYLQERWRNVEICHLG